MADRPSVGSQERIAEPETETKSAVTCVYDSNLIQPDGKIDNDERFNHALNTLLYEAGCPRRLTRKTAKLIQDLDMAGHTEALLLKGIYAFYYGEKAYEHFAAAEGKSLKHPLLDYYLYQCYRLGDKGVSKDMTLADKYYDKYTDAGIPYGAGLQAELQDPDYEVEDKAKLKLERLEVKGKNLASVYELLRAYYLPTYRSQVERFENPWFESVQKHGNYMMYYWEYLHDAQGIRIDYRMSSLGLLVEAEQAGFKDDRILSLLVEALMVLGNPNTIPRDIYDEPDENGWEVLTTREYGYNGEVYVYDLGLKDTLLGDDDSIFDCDDCGYNQLPKIFPPHKDPRLDIGDYNEAFRFFVLGCKFRTRETMALYYARVLIKRGSSEGYLRLGQLYWEGMTHIPRNEKKAVTVWLEADRVNLATYETYMTGLSVAYMNGLGGLEVDGEKALECCMKALSVARTVEEKSLVYKRMAEIYERGITPVVKDDVKAAEFKAKAGVTE